METHIKKIDQFRDDFLKVVSEKGLTMAEVARFYGIKTSTLSYFKAGKRGISSDNLLKLWNFVYGTSFGTNRKF